MGHLAPFQVLNRLDVGVPVGDQLQPVTPEGSVLVAHHGDRVKAGQVNAEHRGTGGEAGNVQAARTHGLDLGGIGFRPVPLHLLAGLF